MRGKSGGQRSENRAKGHLQRGMSSGGSSPGAGGMNQEDIDKVEELLEGEDENTRRLVKAGMQAKRTIRKEDLVAYLKEQIGATQNCIMFPVTFLYFISYAVCILGHENIADSNLVQRHLTGMLDGSTYEGVHVSGHKNLHDIAGKEDVYTYLREVIAPTFITADPQGDDKFRVLRYNQIIGGVQLVQLRRERKSCTGEYPSLGPFIRDGKTNPILAGFGCYPWYTESKECMKTPEEVWDIGVEGWCSDKDREAQGLRRILGQLENETEVKAAAVSRKLERLEMGGDGTAHPGAKPDSDTGEGETFSAYLYEHEGLERALEKINLLQQHGWLDLNTAWLGIRMLIFNPDLAIFVHGTVNVHFTPSGSVQAEVKSQSFVPEPYQDQMALGLDAFFMLFLVLLFAKVFFGIYKAIVAGAGKAWFMDGWHVLDLLTTLGGIGGVIMWLILLQNLESVKQNVLEVRDKTPTLGNMEDGPYKESVTILHNQVASLSAYLKAYRLAVGWYTVFCVGRFFEAFHSQPRLALVTKTLGIASVDLFHFIFVFFLVFMSYAVAAVFIFGTRVWNFSSLKLSVMECFLILMGDFDFDMLGIENPVTAGIWFWTFISFVALIMLNMVMAVIMDCYTEVQGEAADVDPVWTQAGNVFEELVGNFSHNRVSNQELVEKINKLPDDLVEIDEELLLKTGGDRMSLDQCVSIFVGVKSREERALSKGMSLSDTMRAIGWIRIAVGKISVSVEGIIKEEQEELVMLHEIADHPGENGAENGEDGEVDNGGGLGSIMALENDKSPAPDKDDPFKVTGNLSAQFAHGGSPFANHPVDSRLHRVVWRLSKVEEFYNEAMQYTVYRGKDLRNRLAVIEDLLRSQRDSVMMRVEKKVWDRAPPTLGARGSANSGAIGGAPPPKGMSSMM